MKRTIVWVVLVGALALAGGVVSAGNPATGNAREQIKELKRKHKELRMEIGAIQKKLNLRKDPEVIELRQALKKARVALEEKCREKTIIDPAGAAAYKKLDEVTSQIKELRRMSKQKDRKKRRKKGKLEGGAAHPGL